MTSANAASTKGFPPVDRRFVWIGLGLLALFVRYLFSLNPYYTEVVYSRGIFLLVRLVFDYTLGWLPIPLIYVLVPLLLLWGGRKLRQGWRHRRERAWSHRIAGPLLTLAAVFSAGLFFFLLLWGYNYQRVPLAERIGLRVDALDRVALRAELDRATQAALSSRAQVPAQSDSALVWTWDNAALERQVREALETVLADLDYPVTGRVRGRGLYPKGMLMQLGASGIYIPFVAEGHVDAALPGILRPEVLAHELAHGYGFGDEGTCNFLAFLACEASEDARVRYAGRLAYWREVAVEYRRMDPEGYERFRAELPPGFVADNRLINAAYARYPGFFPQMSRTLYHSYLKNQGISEGIASYSRVVLMVAAWQRERGCTTPHSLDRAAIDVLSESSDKKKGSLSISPGQCHPRRRSLSQS